MVLTITDGDPDDEADTAKMVQRLKKKSKMVAFGLGSSPAAANIMAGKLKQFGYDDVAAVSSLRKLPKKLVDLMAPT